MKGLGWLAPTFAAVGLIGFAATFVVEQDAFRSAVVGWAERDLKVRTQLAASTLREPLATSDFRRLHEFSDECESDGVRLVVLSGSGGVFFDSLRSGAAEPASMYETAPCGEFQVKLGLPLERVLAPFNRAKTGFILAGFVGAAGVLLVFFFTYRQSVRIRELARLEKFRRDFIADVSHEIKTPLTGILGAVDLLGDCAEDRHGELLEMVRRESERLNDLAQDILDLARLEREDQILEKTEALPADIVQEALEGLSQKASAAGVSIENRASPSVGASLVLCDPRLVSQALSNLVENAIRHSGSPDVVVSCEASRREVRFVVEDHGKGIPAEHAKRVFERFHRVDPARTAGGGAGLGLAIVRRIARLHGGDVSFSEVSPSGCRFVMTIPR